MKKITLLLVILLPLIVKSQEKQKTFVGFSFGTSIPFGDYGDNDFNNDAAGFAKPGINLNLNYGYYFNEKIGITGMLFTNICKTDIDPIVDMMNNEPNVISGEVSATGSSISGFMPGIIYTFPSEKWFIDLKGYIGIVTAKSPEIKYDLILKDLYNNYYNINIVQESIKAPLTLGYGIGLGLRRKLNEKLNLAFNYEYLGANAKFKDVNTSKGSSTYSQKYSAMNFNIGLAFTF